MGPFLSIVNWKIIATWPRMVPKTVSFYWFKVPLPAIPTQGGTPNVTCQFCTGVSRLDHAVSLLFPPRLLKEMGHQPPQKKPFKKPFKSHKKP